MLSLISRCGVESNSSGESESGVSATIYGDFDEIPDSDSPEEFDSTPHLEINDNTERTCNTGVREMHSGIDNVADGDGDGNGEGNCVYLATRNTAARAILYPLLLIPH